MAATALTKFTQNLTSGGPGRALKGVVGVPVDVENSDNTDVASWQIDLVYSAPGSSIVVSTPYAFNDNSNTPLATFTPDVAGSYRWVMKVWAQPNRAGNPTDVDIRVFIVPEDSGLYLPPTQIWPLPLPDPASGEATAKPNELNFDDQEHGWAGDATDGGLNELIRRLGPLEEDVAALESTTTELQQLVLEVTGLAGVATTSLSGPVVVGALAINPANYPGRTFVFEAILSTVNVAALASIRLYNLDDGEVVADSLLTQTALTPTRTVSVPLTVGAAAGNLKNALKVYEIQLFRNGGAGTDFVTAQLAQISIQP